MFRCSSVSLQRVESFFLAARGGMISFYNRRTVHSGMIACICMFVVCTLISLRMRIRLSVVCSSGHCCLMSVFAGASLK